MSTEEFIFNALGIGLIVLTIYMLGTRVLGPQFLFPWRNRRRMERLRERGGKLLDSARLDDEERLQVQRALNLLERRRHVLSQPGIGNDPLDDAETDIETVWQRHQHEVDDGSFPLGTGGS